MTTVTGTIKDSPIVNLDDTAASGQKVVPVESTVGYAVGDLVQILDDLAGELNIVLSIQAGISLTMLINLTNTYTVAENGKVAGTFDTSANITERIDLWLKATDGVGRFNAKLNNTDNAWGDIIYPDDLIEIKLDGVTMFIGYIDKGYPLATDKNGVHDMTFEVIGRDRGQDLHNKLVNKAPGWMFETQPADDIIDTMLSQASSEITYASPSTAPEISYTDIGDEYLIEAIRKIAEKVEYDFYVDEFKVLHFFAIGSVESGIELNATAEYEGNNIIGEIKTTKFDAFELRNRIIAKGGYVNDGWSDGNASDYEHLAGNTHDNDDNLAFGGVKSIKCLKAAGDHIELSLSFPKFNYDFLPFTFPYSEMNVWAYLVSALSYPDFTVILEDTNGSKIRYQNQLLHFTAPKEVWHQWTFPVGKDCDITDWIGSDEETWQYVDEESYDLKFNWEVVKITFLTTHWTTELTIDALSLPVLMVAYSVDATSQGWYKLREIPLPAKDIRTQSELQEFADAERDKRMNPIGSIKLTAVGSAGIIGDENKWIPGSTIRVTSPEDDLNYVKLRMAEIHHIVLEEPDEDGHDWKVELTLVPYDTPISGKRLSYNESSEVALFRELRAKIRFLEKAMDVGNSWYPPMPGMPTMNKINWWNLPSIQIVDGLVRLKETVLNNWVDLKLQLFEDMAYPDEYNPFFHVAQGFWCQKDVFSQGFLGSASRIYIEFGGTYTPAVAADIGRTVKDDGVYSGVLVGYWNSETDYLNLPTSVDPSDPTAPTWWLVGYYPILSGSTMTIPSGTGGGVTNAEWDTQPGGGAVMIGHGLTAVDDPPKIVLSSSELGFDRLYIHDVGGDLANLAVKDIELTTINGSPPGGIIVSGSNTTDANGNRTVTFDEEFDEIPRVFPSVVDASGRMITIVVTAKSTTQFTVKTKLLDSHKHKTGQAAATTPWTMVVANESAHTHPIGSHKHEIGTKGASVEGIIYDTSYTNTLHQHSFSAGFTTSSVSAGTPSGSIGNNGLHDHCIGGTTGPVYGQIDPYGGHVHSSGGCGVEETTQDGTHNHTFSGNAMSGHSHTGSVSGTTGSGGSNHKHTLQITTWSNPFSLRDSDGTLRTIGAALVNVETAGFSFYTSASSGDTGAGSSHSHTLTDKPPYVRGINLRDIDGEAYPIGSTLVETTKTATDLYTESTTAVGVAVDFDWVAIPAPT